MVVVQSPLDYCVVCVEEQDQFRDNESVVLCCSVWPLSGRQGFNYACIVLS